MNECLSQNDLLLSKLMMFYNKNDNLDKMLCIINVPKISLRIVIGFQLTMQKSFLQYILQRTLLDLKFTRITNLG